MAAIILLMLGGCSGTPAPVMPETYDLTLSHPAPKANYIQVAPAPGRIDLPRPQAILSPGFSAYLRRETGCVVDQRRQSLVLGSHAVPAGYMVPVSCS